MLLIILLLLSPTDNTEYAWTAYKYQADLLHHFMVENIQKQQEKIY